MLRQVCQYVEFFVFDSEFMIIEPHSSGLKHSDKTCSPCPSRNLKWRAAVNANNDNLPSLSARCPCAIRFCGTWLEFALSTLFPFVVGIFHFVSDINWLRGQSAQYSYWFVQIVLRLHRLPAEILSGFDIDTPCPYDGLASPLPFFLFVFFLPDQLRSRYQGMGKPARHCCDDSTM